MKIDGIFACSTLKPLGEKQEISGMLKQPVSWASINKLGLNGDKQGDLRFHGGLEKAVHQYSLQSYRELASQLPQLEPLLQAGAMGENLTVEGMHDTDVCIGDIYQFGTCILQVSQPRQPCHKIGVRFEHKGLENTVGKQGITGWYYRVLQPGMVALDDSVSLLDRPNPEVNVSEVMRIYSGQVKDKSVIQRAIDSQDLCPKWITKLEKRLNQI